MRRQGIAGGVGGSVCGLAAIGLHKHLEITREITPMPLQIYNSRSRKKEPFRPQEPTRVGVYVCGLTVYGPAHIGNARPGVVFDVLVRLLRALYPAVSYTSNVTDIDDKIIAAAAKNEEATGELTERFEAQYWQEMATLGCRPPDNVPRASEYIGDMIALIAELLAKDAAYEAEGHVLFATDAYADYGALSRRPKEAQVAGARVEVAPYKRAPTDFVLWKPSRAGEPSWESPWGMGRPGWHTECAAMIRALHGERLDIHGGGQDLLFPHHENEAAQYGCLHDAPLAPYWMHNALVLNRDKTKMSKSEGAIQTLESLLAAHSGEALRLLLLQTHYRHPLEVGEQALAQAESVLARLYLALRIPQETSVAGPPDDSLADEAAVPEPLREIVRTGLMDDLNLPSVFAQIFLQARRRRPSKEAAAEVRAQLRWLLQFLGFRLEPPPNMAHIESVLRERDTARERKDFARADALREDLESLGVAVKDKPNAPSEWHYATPKRVAPKARQRNAPSRAKGAPTKRKR